ERRLSVFQIEQVSILIVTIFLAVSFWLINKQLQTLKGNQKPNRIAAGIVQFVSWINQYTIDAMGEEYGRKFSAYIGTVFIYLFVSNISGLFGLSAPTSNYSVTLAFAAITWIFIQAVSIKTNGFKGYLKGFLD